MKTTRTFWSVFTSIMLALAVVYAQASAQKLQYLQAKKVDHTDTYFGVNVSDPYRWITSLNRIYTTKENIQRGREDTEKHVPKASLREWRVNT